MEEIRKGIPSLPFHKSTIRQFKVFNQVIYIYLRFLDYTCSQGILLVIYSDFLILWVRKPRKLKIKLLFQDHTASGMGPFFILQFIFVFEQLKTEKHKS